jgi:hypothetical protein
MINIARVNYSYLKCKQNSKFWGDKKTLIENDAVHYIWSYKKNILELEVYQPPTSFSQHKTWFTWQLIQRLIKIIHNKNVGV